LSDDTGKDGHAKPKADAAAEHAWVIREKLDRVPGALQEAEIRQEEKDLFTAEAEAEVAWKKVDRLARADAGVKLDMLILNLAGQYKKLLQLGEVLYHAAPTRAAKLHNFAMSPINIERALRLYLFKKGFKWAAEFRWNSEDIQAFSDVVKDGNTAVLAHRPKFEAPG
jgi:hypothetical protein